jgi:hypothetical protein
MTPEYAEAEQSNKERYCLKRRKKRVLIKMFLKTAVNARGRNVIVLFLFQAQFSEVTFAWKFVDRNCSLQSKYSDEI